MNAPMNAPVHAASGRDCMLARMRQLVSHLEAGDDIRFEACLAELIGVSPQSQRPLQTHLPIHPQAAAQCGIHCGGALSGGPDGGLTPIKSEQGLFVSVARLTRELHDAMQELRMDERLASLAGSEIPDACSRLDYVVKVTEEAAHRTLDLVEHGRELTMQIETCVQSLGQACEREQTGAGSRHTQSRLVASVDELGAQIVATNEQLRGTLSQLAQAQEYQDLAGQVIKRVTQLVRSVERALIDLLRAAGTQVGAGQTVRESPVGGLHGPAIAGLTPAAVSQDDADSLLAELGF